MVSVVVAPPLTPPPQSARAPRLTTQWQRSRWAGAHHVILPAAVHGSALCHLVVAPRRARWPATTPSGCPNRSAAGGWGRGGWLLGSRVVMAGHCCHSGLPVAGCWRHDPQCPGIKASTSQHPGVRRTPQPDRPYLQVEPRRRAADIDPRPPESAESAGKSRRSLLLLPFRAAPRSVGS